MKKSNMILAIVATIAAVMLTAGTVQATQPGELMKFREKPSVAFNSSWNIVVNDEMTVLFNGNPWPNGSRWYIVQVPNDSTSGTYYYIAVSIPGATNRIPVTYNMVYGMEPATRPVTAAPGGSEMRATNGLMEVRTPGGEWGPFFEDPVIIEEIPILHPRWPTKLNGEPRVIGHAYYIYNRDTGTIDVITPDFSRKWTDVFDTGTKVGGVALVAWIVFLCFFFA